MLLDELKSTLKKHGLWAKKSLGQNFLVDEKALDAIVEAADLTSGDRVIEVGPGTGLLTERLLKKAAYVTAVEFDADMVKVLKDRFKGVSNLEIVHSDALNYRIKEVGDYKVVANIPYYITSPLLKHFLQAKNAPNLMVILVQKEVAEKVCGLSGKSLITIETQVFGKPEIVTTVPAGAFYPAPKVDSAVLKINAYDEPLVAPDNMKEFLKIVKVGYGNKRKKLAKNLAALYHIENREMKAQLEDAGIDPDCRAEELLIKDWMQLLTKLKK